MNMEKLTMDDTDQDRLSGSGDDDPANTKSMLATSGDNAESLGSEDNQYRTISLYYMDPNDALAAHAEFKQMGGMTNSDVRVTSVSLGKAIRCAANAGRGLVSGQPIDLFTGKVLGTKEGGSLRHKLMPPKKQLFYAARCLGKERYVAYVTLCYVVLCCGVFVVVSCRVVSCRCCNDVRVVVD